MALIWIISAEYLGDYRLKLTFNDGAVKIFDGKDIISKPLYQVLQSQAIFLSSPQVHPILLLDDIFDKLDSERVERILQLASSDRFGQIFITDTDRQHLSSLIANAPSATLFTVHAGTITQQS